MKLKNTKIVAKEIGSLIIIMSFIFLVPIIVGCIYQEWYSTSAFLLASIISFIVGYGIQTVFKNTPEPQFNHGYVIAALGWLIMTIVGGLPFYLSYVLTPFEVMQSFVPQGQQYTSSMMDYRNYLHCVFESMSAYTTTGLTITMHEPSVGKTVLFYRSFAQWVGGAGFIVLALALIKHGSGRSLRLLYRSESTGLNLRTKVVDTAKGIWQAYSIITIITIVFLIIGTKIILPDYSWADNIFDAINHAMAGLSSGGFSPLDDSIAGYKSAAMDYLLLLPMILGSFSLPFYYRIFYNRKFREVWDDVQTRSLLICFVVGGGIMSLLLWHSQVVPNPFREGVFQYISAISTTGWQTSNIHVWDDRSFCFIIFGAMFIGGAWGGTVGGIKIYRAVFIERGIRWQIKNTFLSGNTIKTFKFDGRTLFQEDVNKELANMGMFVILFLLIMFVSTFISTYFIPSEFTFFDALFESTAAQSTAGLTVGITHPGMNPIVESIYIFQMWVGRLEIIPVLALIRALFKGVNHQF